MDKNSEKLNLLLIRLENLMLRQQNFVAEINALKAEVKSLQAGDDLSVKQYNESVKQGHIEEPTVFQPPQQVPVFNRQPAFEPEHTSYKTFEKFSHTNMVKSDFEKFIGENLISKIGIFILILGVCIGAKYAIDHDLISPLTRIILGYMVGAGLMAFALKLKAKYENFSAVLLSGSIAILYFITYAAYSFYSLIPQELAFGLMVLFTSFTVLAAVKYNKQVIAHIGLVGAYAIPFLLSDGSGKVAVLFSYVAIINAGILVLSFKKYWKPLFYAAFVFTWLIFSSWYLAGDNLPGHFTLAIIFSTVSFLTFYIANLAYKVIRKEQLNFWDTFFVLLNSFIYYGFGYGLVNSVKDGDHFLGLFTLFNAVIHFVICLVVYKRKLADKHLFYLVLAMVIIFITIAFPVQLNGDWVTLFWVAEATILFYLGRIKGIAIYEKIAFPLIFLAFLSLIQDWTHYEPAYDYRTSEVLVKPFINIGFLTGILFIGAFYLMNKINNQVDEQDEPKWWWKSNTLNFALPAILLIVAYMTFRIELTNCFDLFYYSSRIIIHKQVGFSYDNYIYNEDIVNLEIVSICIYSMFFATMLNWLSVKIVKTKALTITSLTISLISLVAFLGIGQYCLANLRESFIAQDNKYFTSEAINLGIRYIGLGFVALLLVSIYQLCKTTLIGIGLSSFFNYIFYLSLLWLLSSELITILDLLQRKDAYKLSLSIFWGIYALFLVVMGLWKNQKHLRIGAMVLFGITLVKLFLYDIAYLDTISKTIVFISLGILLLIISFLYNKYKHLIIDDVKA